MKEPSPLPVAKGDAPLAELVAAVTTPFTPDGNVDLAGLQENLKRLMRTPLTGVLVLGTTGEHPFLDFSEKVELIEAAARARGRLDLYVQVWHQDSRHTKALAELAHAHGARAAVALTPTYYTPNYSRDVLRRYYAELVSQGRTYLYHIPRNTGQRLTVDDVLAIAAEGVSGMKDSSGELASLGELLAKAPANFQVLVGAGEGLLGALALGAAGGILAVAQVAPYLTAEVADRLAAGDLPAAQRAQTALTRLAVTIQRPYGIAGVKYAMDKVGLIGGLPRQPLPTLPPSAAADIDRLLTELALPRLDV